MKKTGAKWMQMMTAVTLLQGLLIGCSSGRDEGSSAQQDGKTEKTVTYSFYKQISAPEYAADGGEARQELIKRWAQAGITGIDYKVEVAAGPDYYTKLNVKAAAGELPDSYQIDSFKTYKKYIDEVLLLPVDEYIKNSPNIQRVVSKKLMDSMRVDGKLYGIPQGIWVGEFNTKTVIGLALRQDWLDKLKLQTPKTVDDVYKVLKAFTELDPDGNGKNDTIGLGGGKDSAFEPIFGAYGITPTSWQLRDGVIKKGFVLPETKDALATLQQWYKEKLIEPDFLVMANQISEGNFLKGKYGASIRPAHGLEASTAFASGFKKSQPDGVLTFIAGPEGPKGLKGVPELDPFSGARVFNSKVQNPENLFKALDWMLSDEGILLTQYGIEGVDYTYDKTKELIVQKSTYPELYKKGYSNPLRWLNVIDQRWTSEPIRKYLIEVKSNTYESPFWQSVSAEERNPDLEAKLWPEYMYKIITGEYPISKWDEFVQKYYAQGGAQIEKEANEAWKKLNGK